MRKAAQRYFSDESNPEGSLPVSSFCDGAPQETAASPYEDTWSRPAPGQGTPVSMALAVDLNKNGMRDENQPSLRQGHERDDHTGSDGRFDKHEPGYDAIPNPPPSQGYYDCQITPNAPARQPRTQMRYP